MSRSRDILAKLCLVMIMFLGLAAIGRTIYEFSHPARAVGAAPPQHVATPEPVEETWEAGPLASELPFSDFDTVFYDENIRIITTLSSSQLAFANGATLDWSDGVLRFEGDTDEAALAFFEVLTGYWGAKCGE